MNDFSADHSSQNVNGIVLDRKSGIPLIQQAVEGLRSAIRSGRFAGGMRLPPTRDLARELGVSRSVTVAAYEQLEAEGYIDGRVGSGSYVAEGAASASPESPPGFSARAHTRSSPSLGLVGAKEPEAGLIDFTMASGCPDLVSFPREEWGRCLSLAARESVGSYGFGDPAGDRALRRAISGYLFRMKGMSCSEDELIVTAGSSQAAIFLGILLRGKYGAIQVEDPTYPPLRALLKRQGLALKPIPVDSSGIPPEEVSAALPLLATPAHHFPTGAVLPADRRVALAKLARAGDSLIIEDDYDGELRQRGFPIQPLRSLAPDRVVFLGTFSKVMYPGIRLGYILAPPSILGKLAAIKGRTALWAEGLSQAALARFIEEGRLDRRVRSLKRDCASKRELIEELAAGLPGGNARVEGEACGMHLRLAFPEGLPADFRSAKTRAAGFIASPVSSFSISRKIGREDSLLIGYGNLDASGIREGFARIGAYITRGKGK